MTRRGGDFSWSQEAVHFGDVNGIQTAKTCYVYPQRFTDSFMETWTVGQTPNLWPMFCKLELILSECKY